MESVRFEKFILLICGIHKHISRLKTVFAAENGIKNVHVLWLYELMIHPEGLTAAELASVSMVDRALISRELEELKNEGYIYAVDGEGRNYNVRLSLTDKGHTVAKDILSTVTHLQEKLDEGIGVEELEPFYRTLEKLYSNFEELSLTDGEKRTVRKRRTVQERAGRPSKGKSNNAHEE